MGNIDMDAINFKKNMKAENKKKEAAGKAEVTSEEAVEEVSENTSPEDITEEITQENSDEMAEEISDEIPDETKEEQSSGNKDKKKLFGRKPKKDPKDEKIEELTDRVTRQMAEFDNFRKRTEKEKAAMYEIGAKSIIEKLLPVVDNFERGFLTVAEEDKDDSFVKGMEMVYKQIMTTFETVGVKPIEAVGQEFDPNLHNAVMHVEDDTVGENIVVEEFQKGYTYRDTVVRYSMVKVAN